ncbi:alpha-(1,3)-fucosyltransferase C [Patella vulgata]|uniref:alpha-(1,3)-fucosyltransferase C n=1 Tax=Patella vulgata TaxID=6465 RepID=UPI00217FE2F9|nr:alpha-(1,3)-fucosyltransferase C [Patella vulgata]
MAMEWFGFMKRRYSRKNGRYSMKHYLLFVVVMVVGYNLLTIEDLNDTSKINYNYPKIFPERYVSKREIKRILFWTKDYGSITWQTFGHYSIRDAFKGCAVSKCIVTADKALVSESDALLFHPPDFITTFSLPSVRFPEQIYIYASMEPPPNHYLMNLRKYSNFFNWTLGYRSDMDILHTYGHLKKLPSVNKSVEQIDFSKHKTHKVVWAVGNCYPYSPRQLTAQELSKYIDVDVIGHCGKTYPKCSGVICPEVLGKYKFYLSFENSLCKDYVTEKFWNALVREQIPIVRGGADYTKIAPPNSFINVLDFPNIKKLAEYIHYLDKNHTAYNEYFKWRSHFEIGYTDWRCELCKALHDTSRPAQMYTDLYRWMSEENCPVWSFSNQISRYVNGFFINMGIKWF